MTKSEALKKLNTLLEELKDLPPFQYEGDNSKFEKWERKATRHIEEIFNNENSQTSEFQDIEFTYIDHIPDSMFTDITSFSKDAISAHSKGRERAITLLESFIEEVKEWADTAEDTANKELIKYLIQSTSLQREHFDRYGVNEDFDEWKINVKDFIKRTFTKDSDEYKAFKNISFYYIGPRGFHGVQVPLDKTTYINGLKTAKIQLKVIKANIERYGIPVQNIQSPTIAISTEKKNTSNKVFIVHGHDELAISQVSEVIRKLKLEPIVLRDQISRSNTVIEKIEAHTSDVSFGVILYTECDLGGKDIDSLQSRARQNVVLEHGYLMAKIGRENTFALVKGKVETPGDISGVVYEPMDDHKAWSYKLVKELKASGFDVDSNDLL